MASSLVHTPVLDLASLFLSTLLSFELHCPFTFTGLDSDAEDGHKCLIAATTADGEPPVADSFDAPNSNQVAQRNVQVSNSCTYPLTNANAEDGSVAITLSVVPAERSVSLDTDDNNVEVTFDGPDLAWFNIWVLQPGQGTDFLVSQVGGKTTVRLGKPSVSLAAVPLHSGETRTSIGTLDLVTDESLTKLNIQATLTDSTGSAVVSNGGTCQDTGPGPIG